MFALPVSENDTIIGTPLALPLATMLFLWFNPIYLWKYRSKIQLSRKVNCNKMAEPTSFVMLNGLVISDYRMTDGLVPF